MFKIRMNFMFIKGIQLNTTTLVYDGIPLKNKEKENKEIYYV